jgi:5-methylcytosine-specific restriction endonuclease McrA
MAPAGPQHSVLYTLYMQSQAWQVKRQQVLRRANGRCERCGQFAKWLDVHHLSYRNLANEPLEELQGLCRPCHDIAEQAADHPYPGPSYVGVKVAHLTADPSHPGDYHGTKSPSYGARKE